MSDEKRDDVTKNEEPDVEGHFDDITDDITDDIV